MEQKAYIVTETWREVGEDVRNCTLGVFTNQEAARKCLSDAKARTLREWEDVIDEDNEDWEIVDNPDVYDATRVSDYEYFVTLEIEAKPLQDSYTGWQELTKQMNEKQLEAFNEFTNEFSAGIVCNRAARDMEKPMGFILTYLRDQGLPKTEGWIVGEAILKYLQIDNENCPWLNNN